MLNKKRNDAIGQYPAYAHLDTQPFAVFFLVCMSILLPARTAVAGETDVKTIEAAISDPTRMEAHRERDAGRLPSEVLQFAGVKQGDNVGEIAGGSGYYAALLSRVVGDSGHVYVVSPKKLFPYFPAAEEAFPKYIAADPRQNISRTVQDLDELTIPEELDAVFMVLYYHDTIWTGEDRSAMNKSIFDALVPGGAYLVVDHHALKGAGDSVTKDLHRMDVSQVVPEITSAGFELIKDSSILANPADPKVQSVFDENWRGKTDRFMFLFQKPKD